MTAKILDGKLLSKQIREELRVEVADFIENNAEVPTLAAVLVGDDPASQVYVRNKVTGCEQVGMQSRLFRLPAETTTDELLTLIAKLNKPKDDPVHGILVQTPLPKQVDATRVLLAVSPLKDVDGFHPENLGRLVLGKPRFVACTPLGIQQLLLRNDIEIAGRRVVVVGRSETVGKPMALTAHAARRRRRCHGHGLPQQDARPGRRDATGRYPDRGDRPAALHHGRHDQARRHGGRRRHPSHASKAWWATSISRQPAKLPARITPVPGGVGPLTVTMLLVNTLAAARLQQ